MHDRMYVEVHGNIILSFKIR